MVHSGLPPISSTNWVIVSTSVSADAARPEAVFLSCYIVGVTPAGTRVFRRIWPASGRQKSRAWTYFFAIGTTHLALTYSRHRPGYKGSYYSAEDRPAGYISASPYVGDEFDVSYQFEPGELEMLIDSFEEVEASALPPISLR